MTDTTPPTPGLDARDIVGEAYAVYFTRLFRLSLAALVPLVALGLPSAIAAARAALDGYFVPPPSLFLETLKALVSVFASGLLVRGAHKAARGRPIRILELVAETLTRAVPLYACSLVVALASGIGMLALIVPGLWILAAWSAVVPAIVIEGAGFQAFRRSAALTRGRRWPIAGVLVALGIFAYAPWLLVAFVTSPGLMETVGVPVWALVVQSASAVGLGVVLTGFGVLYVHLRRLEDAGRAEPEPD